jgi:hypothetical protein
MHHQSPRPAPRVATFLWSAEVAAILQVSPRLIRRWNQESPLPHQRPLGDHCRYSVTTIEQLAASLVQEVRAA